MGGLAGDTPSLPGPRSQRLQGQLFLAQLVACKHTHNGVCVYIHIFVCIYTHLRTTRVLGRDPAFYCENMILSDFFFISDFPTNTLL